MTYRIIQGDTRAALRELPAEHFHCAVTSPPYWGLRDYGVAGQIGREPSLDEYVATMVDVFGAVRRVLRADGTLWLNLGSAMAGGGRAGKNPEYQARHKSMGGGPETFGVPMPIPPGYKAKDLIPIPWLVAMALQADGWWLRNDIIWHKPNPQPESCTDRCTHAHDYLFLMSKAAHYYYDQDAIRERTGNEATPEEYEAARGSNKGADAERLGEGYQKHSPGLTHPQGRNKRDVWTIRTGGYSGLHFASYPPALVEPCIRAGTSEHGCCPKCGAPWERIVERSGGTIGKSWNDHDPEKRLREGHRIKDQAACHGRGGHEPYRVKTLGWRPGCHCPGLDGDSPGSACADEDNWPRVPCRVLDPFAGAGTTSLVAQRLGRDSVGIELNPEYVAMAERRIKADRPLLNQGG